MYRNDYLDYWELQNVPNVPKFSTEERNRKRELAAIGDSLRKCLHSLHTEPEAAHRIREFIRGLGGKGDLDADIIARVAKALAGLGIVRDSIRIQLGFEAADSLLNGAERRAEVLLSLLGLKEISERAALFLDRATKLYLWGFDPECVIMCVGVLEAALESRFPPTEMSKLQITKAGPEYNAQQYVYAAYAARVFDAEDRDTATRLRRARNDAMHNIPGLAMDPERALTALMTLLGKIYPPDSP